MSMIELGFFLVCAAMTAIGWVVASHICVEWYCRVLAAVSAGFIPVVVVKGILKSNARRMRKRPPHPVCENGTCTWVDYHAVKSHGSDIEFMCKCGRRYLKSGKQFLKLPENGQTSPYKRLGGEQLWEDDIEG